MKDREQDDPLEFRILEYRAVGLAGPAWFQGEIKLGWNLEGILNKFGTEGWDVVPNALGTPLRILLKRKAR